MAFTYGIFPKLLALVYGAKIVEKRVYVYNKISSEVYIIQKNDSSRSIAAGGMYIFLHEILFQNYSKNVQDFFFLHEYGHLKMNFILKILIYLPLIFLGVSFIPIFFILPFSIYNFLHISNPYTKFILLLNTILFFFVGLSFTLLNWINELYAELWAVKQIGSAEYFQIIKELDE